MLRGLHEWTEGSEAYCLEGTKSSFQKRGHQQLGKSSHTKYPLSPPQVHFNTQITDILALIAVFVAGISNGYMVQIACCEIPKCVGTLVERVHVDQKNDLVFGPIPLDKMNISKREGNAQVRGCWILVIPNVGTSLPKSSNY